MEDIQSWWELPSIAHFCSLFRAAFDLLDFDIEELEEAILTDGFDRSGSPLLIELLVRLLQGCLPGRNITPCNVDSYLRKLFRQKCQEDPTRENLFVEGEFRKLVLRKKVEVLHALCDFRLEAEDVLDLLKNLETESLRVEPLGFDDNGSTYWYFYGTRLYREDNSMFHPLRRRPREKEKDKEDKRKKKRKKKGHKEDSGAEEDEPIPNWQVQCYTEDDWRALSKTFEGCESRLEKSLLQTLKDDFLPEIPRLFEEKEKIQQKRMMEFAPRRTSGRVQKMKEKREEEERRLAEELVVQEKKRIEEEEKRRLEDDHVVEQEVVEIGDDEEELEEVVRKVEEIKEEEHEEDLVKREVEDEEDAVIRIADERKEDKGKKRKRKEEEGSNKRIERWFEREDEVLHELNKEAEAEERQRHHRNHKQKKPHHRKHHKRSRHHSRTSETLMLDHQIASDTSNKENSCLGGAALSGDEDDLTHPEDDLTQPEDDLTQPQVYSGRKTNNSLSSLAFSLTPASVVPEPPTQMVTSPPNKKRVKSAHMLLQTEDDLKTGMYKVLEHLRDHEDAWPFLDPVDETFAPNYYAVIRRPMYITKMESRLDSGFYASLVLFEADFKLMMDNCKLYNGPESEYTHMAYTLEKTFAKLRSKYLETEFSSDEEIYIDMSFQQLSKRKNKKKNSEEKKSSEEDTGKRGKKKRKVGRKPKRKPEEEKPVEKKVKGKVKREEREKREEKDRREEKERKEEREKREEKERREEKEKNKGKKKSKHKKEKDIEILHEENTLKEEERVTKEAKESKEREEEEEEEEDDEDEYEEPLLLVREDPYPEEEEEENDDDKYRQTDAQTRLETPPPSDLEPIDDSPGGGVPWDSNSPQVGALSPVPPKWKKEPDKGKAVIKEEETHRKKKGKRKKKREEEEEEEKGKRKKKRDEEEEQEEEKVKRKKRREEEEEEEKEKRKKKRDEEEEEEEEKVKRKKKREEEHSEIGEIKGAEIPAAPSDSESDAGADGVLLYYKMEEEEEEEEKKDHVIERHSELFGEVKDIEEEEGKKKEGRKGQGGHSARSGKRRGSSGKIRKRHRRGAEYKHHHHKSKSKHHHRRRDRHNNIGKESPGKKVLKVEEVFEYSEDDPNSRDPEGAAIPVSPGGKVGDAPEAKLHSGAPQRKKNRRKGKHSKHVKRKEAREKARKASKRKSIKKIIKKKRKQIPIQKMAAIDALSAATEQTLKDITSLLDDPEVPRFTGESPEEDLTFSQRVTSQEFDSIALKIETEYRRKLKMDPSEEKKIHKKKKRKIPDGGEDDGGVLEKKKTEEREREKERKTTEFLLDNTKELFKDIKDGRIKPGAIIKSKDIAKKEGVVKKETKEPAEVKPKGKQNPFGKINKQENSKLTTLIAKAKESRIGLVPNSEVGDSPKLSLGSIILFGDIGSGKHSSREPNSPEEEDKMSDKVEKWDSPWDNRWERPPDIKEESNPPLSQHTEEEEEQEVEEVEEGSPTPERLPEEIIPPSTPRGPEFKQERATPNLSAWFRAFGGPKLTAAPRKRMEDDDEEEEDEENREEDVMCGEEEGEMKEDEDVEKKEDEEVKVDSPDDGSVHDNQASIPGPPSNNSIEPPLSPQPPLSPEKPPETPWFDKIDEKEDDPIWKKSKTEEEDDPYKFEEEELDRAREEAKKLEVERQRKASVSSSGLSDPSPLNIDSDRSPAAFSSEGERSPLTCSPVTRSPVTRSPVTPGFGATKQFSPVTDKSPSVPVYSPRFDTGLGKSYVGYEDKSKYQANGSMKVGFYQDMTDKSGTDKSDTPKGLDQKIKESPIYSPTVPYVSPLYSNKDQSMCKQKSPGRYSSYYSSIDSSTMDKPKTPGYYSTSAPSTPSDRPSSVAPGPTEDKPQPQPQYNYYNYDPTKSLTDQYKNTGSNAKPFYPNEISSKGPDRSPISNSVTPAPVGIVTPVGLGSPLKIVSKASTTSDMQPPKKRQAVERAQNQLLVNQQESLLPTWDAKGNEPERPITAGERPITAGRSNPFSHHPLPANLANLSHIISRIPEPEPEPSLNKDSALLTKTVQPTHPAHLFEPPTGLPQASPSNLPQPSLLSGRSVDMPLTLDLDHSPMSDLPHPSPLLVGKNPPAAHQKVSSEGERPGSRNMPPPHAGEKPHGYLHQKTMWSSSLPTSIPSTLSSLVSNATMASIALGGPKGLGSFPSEHLAQFGIASLAGRSSQAGGQLFSHDLLQRNPSNQNQNNSSSLPTPTGLSLQPHLNGTSSVSGSSSGTVGHSRSSSVSSGSNTSIQSGSGSSSSMGTSASSNNFDLGLARSYASMMSANQSSPLLVRNEAPLTPGSLPRSLSGSSSPFLPQSPGLGAALNMTGSSRTPTPAHQQSIGQGNFPAIPRDPRDPISQSHPSLQIPSLNSIAVSQAQSLSHLNAAGLASYNPRDSLALMNQGGRGPLVGVDPASQQLYQQYLQRHQFAQEELLLRSAGAHSQLAHQSMMIQQGLMSAAGVSYPSGYPHSLGLRSGTYQSMNRPWI